MTGCATHQTGVPNPRVGAYYGAGSITTLLVASTALPWSGVLVWPAVVLGIVTIGYYGGGGGVFRKAGGRLPLWSRLVFGPVLLGHRLSLAWYQRSCRPWDAVTPRVWVGRVLTDTEANEAVGRGVTSVLDLTSEFSEARPFLAIDYRNVPIMDLTAPTGEQLREAVDFIASRAGSGTVYVHCKIGYSRSVAVVGAYLLASGEVPTADKAIERIRQARPSVVVRAEVVDTLREVEQDLQHPLPADAASRTEGE